MHTNKLYERFLRSFESIHRSDRQLSIVHDATDSQSHLFLQIFLLKSQNLNFLYYDVTNGCKA